MGTQNAQSSETSLASPEWQTALDNSQTRSFIHHGDLSHFTFEYPEVEAFLQAFQKQPPIPPTVHFKYTYSKFRHYIRTAREKLSSSPSGRHMGHYKTLYLMKDESMLSIIFEIIQLSMQYGITLDRYKLVTLTLLEKEQNHPKSTASVQLL